jgi:hypothetical protein
MRILLALLAPICLSGCIAKTAVDIVTLPVKAVGAGVDAVTTSQSEADERRGRALRKQEEREGREARRLQKEQERAWRAPEQREGDRPREDE